MYPRLVVHTSQIIENSKLMVQIAKENHIDYVMGIVKVLAGHLDIANELAKTGWTHIGDSRIQNLKKLQSIPLPKVLVRLPMLSEIEDVINYADISLNSEIETIRQLNNIARKKQRIHQIILMFDLGDLREGLFFQSHYLEIVKEVLTFTNIHLIGIGTNLTCYGGLIPNQEILQRLVTIKETIETTLAYPLEIISGGNSSTVTLFGQHVIPSSINSLRLGESIFFGKETSYSTYIKGFHHHNFVLEAQIIEAQTKPSYPLGPTSINSFGEKVTIEDKGLMRRAILAIGKQDVILEHLTPLDPDVHILGGSSDHMICDITNTTYQLGDVLSFRPNYPGLLYLMNSDYVHKVFKKK